MIISCLVQLVVGPFLNAYSLLILGYLLTISVRKRGMLLSLPSCSALRRPNAVNYIVGGELSDSVR
jgi:hypothetical protein